MLVDNAVVVLENIIRHYQMGASPRAAAERGAREVAIHAQLSALGFWERAGYVAEGAEFEEAGIAHIAMRRAL
jgi:predicted GNAT family N-acyltransferase